MPRLAAAGAGLHDELLPAPPACRRAMKASANTDPARMAAMAPALRPPGWAA